MAKSRSPWRVLRLFLLAGAAALAWLAFSTSAATADSASDSLLGSTTTSVSSLTASVNAPVPEPIDAIPSPDAPSPSLLQPMAGSIASAGGQLAAGLPVADQLVPTGTVSTVSDPIAATADDAAVALVDGVAPSLVEAVPVLDPVLQPVTDLVDGALQPLTLPNVGVEGLNPTVEIAGQAAASAIANQGAEFVGSSDVPPAGASAVKQDRAAASFADSLINTGSQSAWAEAPVTVDHSPVPAPAPPDPSSAPGVGASPTGSPGSAAWLDPFGLHLPPAGVVPVSGVTLHSPAPVSFDPCSSPD